VLVVRVHELVKEKVWRKRYDQINAFEETLTAAGTVILKFFLNISRDEQRKRLQERIDDPPNTGSSSTATSRSASSGTTT